jgi:DnaJ-class molecular chaperone
MKKRMNKTFVTIEQEGHVQRSQVIPGGPKKSCPHCGGTGFINESQVSLGKVPCAKCSGTGLVSVG